MTEEFANKLVYLATPYIHFGPGPDAAFIDACTIAARLLATGITTYSPIVYWHPIARYGDIDALDHDLWMQFNEAMLRRADILLVAHMDGWEQSKGIAREVAYFERAGKPIWDLEPIDLTMTKRPFLAPRGSKGHQLPLRYRGDEKDPYVLGHSKIPSEQGGAST